MKRAAATIVALAALVAVGVRPSSASFSSAGANRSTAFAAAPSFNTVAVSLSDPGSPLRGSVTLSATASSARGVASVTFQRAAAGTGAWTDVCTDATAPYSCALDTSALADGLWDLRARALDAAGYTATSTVGSRRVDNTAPTPTVADPGSPLTGTVTLSGSAVDGGSGVASITLQYRPPSGSWTDVCTRAAATASCAWATGGLADGLYDLRAVASDAAGNTGTSAAVSNRRVDNTAPSITMSDPGTNLRGAVTLSSTTADGAGSGVASVRYQVKPTASTSWADACVATAAPFSCSWDTTGGADGLYDVRAIATDGVGLGTTSAAVSGRRVDNTAPMLATLVDPGSPLHGTVTLAATALDTGSGIASVRVERAPSGGSTWTTVCTATALPYSCAWDTTGTADGTYDLRAVAVDAAGNTLASAVVAARRVDNTGPSLTVTDPGSPLRGSVTVTTTAGDPSGVQSVDIQVKPSSGSTWTTLCTSLVAPYSCSWATTSYADGSYDLRAQATDLLGNRSTSATVAARVVDNTPPRGTDIQGANGGVAGRLDAGDTLTLGYSEAIAPASVLAGWTGAATAIKLSLSNTGGNDHLALLTTAGARLPLLAAGQDIALGANFVNGSGATFDATMALSGSNVVITVGAATVGSSRSNVGGTNPMSWSPGTSVTDLAGNPCAATAVTESGALDVDF